MVVQNQDGKFYVYLVYKLFEDVNTPLRHFIDLFDTETEAKEFSKKFVVLLQESV
ncbi:hypothetical protein QFZ80_000234 [Paenibacillus sp. V4I7]|nr:hypothetical protein [Paenibacillus sp. V4I7]MDQ0914050.1 hypothetical protein [Paenibacillus sp. V4I5]